MFYLECRLPWFFVLGIHHYTMTRERRASPRCADAGRLHHCRHRHRAPPSPSPLPLPLPLRSPSPSPSPSPLCRATWGAVLKSLGQSRHANAAVALPPRRWRWRVTSGSRASSRRGKRGGSRGGEMRGRRGGGASASARRQARLVAQQEHRPPLRAPRLAPRAQARRSRALRGATTPAAMARRGRSNGGRWKDNATTQQGE